MRITRIATDNLKLLSEAADAALAERRERVGAAEEDTEEAYWVRHRLVRLLGIPLRAPGRGRVWVCWAE